MRPDFDPLQRGARVAVAPSDPPRNLMSVVCAYPETRGVETWSLFVKWTTKARP
jgi:hypothetical protein